MDVVGGTFVGGSSSGWSIVDPNANAHALGMVAQPVYGGGYSAPAASFGMPPAYASNGFVGGSWSPEPMGNNQILYGHYSQQGALALPQAFHGQQNTGMTPTTTVPTSAVPATATPATTTAATTAGGGSTAAAPARTAPKPAADAAAKPAAAEKKPAPKKTVTVKAGDNLSRIAAKAGTTWQKLYEANKDLIGANPNLIRPGQTLNIPA